MLILFSSFYMLTYKSYADNKFKLRNENRHAARCTYLTDILKVAF